MFDAGQINWLAVILATVAYMVLGSLWYGPLFGKTWIAAIGKTQEELGSPMQGILISAISTLVMVIAFALLLTLPASVNLATGVLMGALVGIGFLATTASTTAAFENKNLTVLLLGIGYQVLGLLIMGAILGVWR